MDKTMQCAMCDAAFTVGRYSPRKTCDDCRRNLRREQCAAFDRKRRPTPVHHLTCPRCGAAFVFTSTGGRIATYCEECRGKRDSKDWPRDRPSPISYETRKRHHLKSRFGLTLAEFDQMLESQDGRCAICSDEIDRSAHVDHDHTCCPGERSCGACVRALLCGRCNKGLGLFRDNSSSLRSAAAYLEAFTTRSAVA